MVRFQIGLLETSHLAWHLRGHNELDEPGFTQPVMYDKIRNRKSVPEMYQAKLLVRYLSHQDLIILTLPSFQESGILTNDLVTRQHNEYKSHLEAQLAASETYQPKADMLTEQWTGLVWPASKEAERDPVTGVDLETLRRIGNASVALPEGFVRLFIPDR